MPAPYDTTPRQFHGKDDSPQSTIEVLPAPSRSRSPARDRDSFYDEGKARRRTPQVPPRTPPVPNRDLNNPLPPWPRSAMAQVRIEPLRGPTGLETLINGDPRPLLNMMLPPPLPRMIAAKPVQWLGSPSSPVEQRHQSLGPARETGPAPSTRGVTPWNQRDGVSSTRVERVESPAQVRGTTFSPKSTPRANPLSGAYDDDEHFRLFTGMVRDRHARLKKRMRKVDESTLKRDRKRRSQKHLELKKRAYESIVELIKGYEENMRRLEAELYVIPLEE